MKKSCALVVLLVAWSSAVGVARTWVSSEGKSIEADFVKLEGAVVHMKKGGKVYKVPLDKLSEDDQEYAKEQSEGAEETEGEDTGEAPSEKPVVKLPFKLNQKVSGPDLKAEDIAGKPIVIHQWNAHCGACPPSLKGFEKLAKRKKKSGATFLILHYYDKIGMAKSKSESLGLKLPIYHGGGIKWDEAKFGKFTWPHVVLVNQAGEVVYMGAEDRKFDKAFKKLLE